MSAASLEQLFSDVDKILAAQTGTRGTTSTVLLVYIVYIPLICEVLDTLCKLKQIYYEVSERIY